MAVQLCKNIDFNILKLYLGVYNICILLMPG